VLPVQALPTIGWVVGHALLLPPVQVHFSVWPQRHVPMFGYGQLPCAVVQVSPTVGLVAGQTKVARQVQLWLVAPQVQSEPGNEQLPLTMPQAAPSVGAAAGQIKVSWQLHSRGRAAAPPEPPLLEPPALAPPPPPGVGRVALHVQRSPG